MQLILAAAGREKEEAEEVLEVEVVKESKEEGEKERGIRQGKSKGK